MATPRTARPSGVYFSRALCLLLLIALLACTVLPPTHAPMAMLPMVCLICFCVVLPLLAQTAAMDGTIALPLRPSLRRVQIQLPPPHLLP